MTKSERGILSEWQVACHRRKFHDETLFAHRLKTPFAEIDLVMRADGPEFSIIEVKTDASYVRDLDPLSWRQTARLRAAKQFLDEELSADIRLILAIVSQEPENLLLCRVRYFDLLT